MANEDRAMESNESLESYKQELAQWGGELTDRAIKLDFNGEDCEKVEKLVAGVVRAGIEAFSPETKWTKHMFHRMVNTRASKAAGPHEAELIKTLLEEETASHGAGNRELPVATNGKNKTVSSTEEYATYAPDPRGQFSIGDIVSLVLEGGETDATFVGILDEQAMFRVSTTEDDGSQVPDVIPVPLSQLYQDEGKEGGHPSATHEPPPEIATVSVVVPPAIGSSTAPFSREARGNKIPPLHVRVRSGETDIRTVPDDLLKKLIERDEHLRSAVEAELTRRNEEKEKRAEESKQPEISKGKEGKRPVEKLFESIAAGQEIDDKVLQSFIKDERTSAEERMKLEVELNARKEKRRSVLERRAIEAVINYKEGDALPPEKLLRKIKDTPEVADFLNAHPEFAPKEEPKKIKKPPLSGKALADAIEAGRPIGVVAEETDEIQAVLRRQESANAQAPQTSRAEGGGENAQTPIKIDVSSDSAPPELESRINPDEIDHGGFKKGQRVRMKKVPGVDTPDTEFHIGSFDPDNIHVVVKETGLGVAIADIESADAPTGEVVTPQTAAEKLKKVTDEARELVAKADAGGVPLYYTESFKRILEENNISYNDNMTPGDGIERIREKIKAEQGALQPDTAPTSTSDDGIPVLTDVVTPDEAKKLGLTNEEPSHGEITPPPTPSHDSERPATAATPEVKNAAPLNQGVVRQFETKFGISEGKLQNIEAFKELSIGQQMLVLKNLEQSVLGVVKANAKAAQAEEWKKTSILQKMWKQLYSAGMNPEYRVAELEKEILAKYRDGAEGDPIHIKNLAYVEVLAKVAKEGPEVKVKEGDELEIAYVSGKDLFGSNEDPAITPEYRKVIEDFNSTASEFAKLPHEWGYETTDLSKGEHKIYEEKKMAYEKARAGMLELYRSRYTEEFAAAPQSKGEDPEKWAMRTMNTLDERVQLNQLFNTHPDAEAALGQIEDQSVIGAAAKEFWKAKGMFVAYGAAVRGATLALVGGMPALGGVIAYAATPFISGMVGQSIGETQAKRLIRERRVDGRMSQEELREEIEFTVPTYEVNPDGSTKLDGTGNRIQKGTHKSTRQIKEFTDSTFFADRIDRLTKKLDQAIDASERQLLEKKIAQTITLASEKFERGMINFSITSIDASKRLPWSLATNRLSFVQALAYGRVRTTLDDEAMKEEFKKITGLHQQKIEEARKEEIASAGMKAGMWRAGFALAGVGIADGVRQIMYFGEPGSFGTSVVKAPPSDAQEVAPSGVSPQHALDASPDAADATRPLWLGANEEIITGDQAAVSVAEGDGEVATLVYTVKSGDNLTRIMKDHLGIMKDLTPEQQENVIQNFIRQLSDEEKAQIGITDVNKIQIGQNIQLDKLNEILLHKEVGGENIITHAEHLGEQASPAGSNLGEPEKYVGQDEHGVVLGQPQSMDGTVEVPRPADTPLSMEETRSTWKNLPEELKLPQARLEGDRYLAADIEELFPKPLFAPVSPEWLTLRDRDALTIIETDPRTLSGDPGFSKGYEWPTVTKIQQYINEHGLTREKGYAPEEKETLGDFLARAHAEKVLRDGPSRPFAQGRILR